jgi:hypothetical protein
MARLEYNVARFNAEHPGSFPLAASAGVWRCPLKGRRWKSPSPTPMKRCMRASAPDAKSDNSVNSGFLR